ncbi:hypothetical protein [Bradyrhizobium guangzhouense]|uniref:hypothetical protein n=1 Tax=Bradyrhizobium guangzhouense TaxID=1325095 RepID=UPI001009E710|nr:hypothetical protein [Bradyrhizobium guangzhouense]RXH07266.1 hypothetical protein EAS54_37980 [Bradyrhizobium guangzhouense]
MPIAGDLISIGAPLRYLSTLAGFFCACGDAVIAAFTRRVLGLTPGRRFAENRFRMPSNRKLRFNIRISTEDEINGTVKRVV